MCDLYIRIHEECEKRGILDAQLCSALGYPASTLSDLKNGKKKTLSQEKLIAIAEYLNVSIDYLVIGKKEKPTDYGERDEMTEELITLFNSKTKEQREAILQLLRSSL